MKKYIMYALVLLVIVFASLFIVEIYKNKHVNDMGTQSRVEELQKRIIDLENSKNEQSKAIENLNDEVGQSKEAQSEDGQMKKLEDAINELKASVKNSNTKQLESRVSAIELFLWNRFHFGE